MPPTSVLPPYSETLTTPAYDALTPPLSTSSSRSSESPPAYPSPPVLDPVSRLPPAFRIGTHDARPVVEVPRLVDHCRFLASLWQLRKNVVETPWMSTRAGPGGEDVDEATKWSVFCSLAEKRFEFWMTETLARRFKDRGGHGAMPLATDELPGIEVIMVWHSYMLNPRWYYEDCTRMFPQLAALGPFPLPQIAACIDPITFQYSPPAKQTVPPYPVIPDETTQPILCPDCQAVNNVLVLATRPIVIVQPPVNASQPPVLPRLGFTQKGWSHSCRGCGMFITHDALQAGKFYTDLARVLKGEMVFLPGLGIHPVTGEVDAYNPEALPISLSREIARVFLDNGAGYLAGKKELLEAGIRRVWTDDVTVRSEDKLRERIASMPTHSVAVEMARAMAWSVANGQELLQALGGRMLMKGLPTRVRINVRNDMLGRRMNRMYSAYTHSSLASLALGPAVQRQANFISKCKELGWLEPGRWDAEAGKSVFILQRSAARYHAFLDLMSATPGGFLVPTLDIDLSWHTHQLQGEKYRTETTRYIGRFVDHDDKVSETKLGDAYDLTSRAWSARFGVPYSACGCHQHGVFAGADGPNLPGKLKFWAKDKESKADKRARLIESAIQRMEQGEKDASHPSVHNLVAVVNLKETDWERRQRAAKQRERDGKAEKLASKAEKNAKARAEVALTQKKDHPDPFLYSPGMMGMGMYPGGVYSNGTSRGSAMPYWGVAAGVGVVGVGAGAVGWGLYESDPHCMDGQQMQRGACAAGVGGAGGGYCGTGGGAACAGASACAAGAGACSAGAGDGCASSGGGGCGGGGGGCGGGGGGGGCGGGGS